MMGTDINAKAVAPGQAGRANPNIKYPNVLNCRGGFNRDIKCQNSLLFLSFEFLSFDIVSDFEFRISSLNSSTYGKTFCYKKHEFHNLGSA
jgi:hypothetical protein